MGQAMRRAMRGERGGEARREERISQLKLLTSRDHFWIRKTERKWGSCIFASPVGLCVFCIRFVFLKKAVCNCSKKSVFPRLLVFLSNLLPRPAPRLLCNAGVACFVCSLQRCCVQAPSGSRHARLGSYRIGCWLTRCSVCSRRSLGKVSLD